MKISGFCIYNVILYVEDVPCSSQWLRTSVLATSSPGLTIDFDEVTIYSFRPQSLYPKSW